MSVRRRRSLAVAAAVVVAVGVGLGVHAASAPRATTADAWRLVGTAPLSAREGAVVAPVGDSLVVFGGRRFFDCPANAACPFPGYRGDGAVYDIRARTWTRMAQAPHATPIGPWAVDGNMLLMLTEDTRHRVV